MQYRISDMIIDTDQFNITGAVGEVVVEPKVFDLLVYLLEHPDRVVSREELFREVWQGRDVSDTTLSNHIKSARKALGDNGEMQQIIQTVRGRGYRLVAPVSAGTMEESAVDPAGLTPPAAAGERMPKPPGIPWYYFTLPVALFLGLSVVAFSLRESVQRTEPVIEIAGTPAVQAPYILVVPFDILGATEAIDRSFADQVTREVIYNLRKISGLRVVPPPSAFAFSTDKTCETIRQRLPGVRYVLDGAVSIGADNSVRITSELEDLASGDLVWDAQYQSRVDNTNFFSVQSEIAASVSESLQVVVLDEEQRALGELPTTSLDAYEAYVAGREQMDLFNQDSLHRAIGLFDEAIALDNEFISAYAARADANRMLMTYFEPPINMLQAVVDSVSDALALDPGSAQALSSLGMAYVLAWRWQDAWTMLNAARQRDPDLALTELGFALYYSGLGDRDNVIRSVERANRIDPLNIELADWGQWALAMVGELEAARYWGEEKMRQHPNVGIVFTGSSVPASIAGDHETAITLAETGLAMDPESPIAMITLAQIYGAAGQVDKVQPLLDQAEAIGGYMCPYETAVAYLNLGAIDKVFELLDEALSYRSNCLIFLRNDPRMRPLESDPRYTMLLARVGLDDTAIASYNR